MRFQITVGLLLATMFPAGLSRAANVDYSKKIAPLLRKYCVSCHNGDDKEGKLSLASFAEMQRGGSKGPAILPGNSKASRLIRMLVGQAKPQMPPEGSDAPTTAELDLLRAWIDAGAKGPNGKEPDRTQLLTPRIQAVNAPKGITALDRSPDGKWLAVARFQEVQLLSTSDQRVLKRFSKHPGKVVNVRFSRDGKRLVSSSGVAGLYGLATIWNVETGKIERTFQGHRDIVFAAELSGNGKLLATASYDSKIVIWNALDGKVVRTLNGHNDAVYDVTFNKDDSILASASGDETIKLWQVASGRRLDTLGQPLEEQYVVRFSPDGKYVVGGGADNRIRVWQVVSKNKPRINPLLYARFAHEGPVTQLAFSPDGKTLVSASADRTIKTWETERYTQRHAYAAQPDTIGGAIVSGDNKRVLVGRMDGQLVTLPLIVEPSHRVTTHTDMPTVIAKGDMNSGEDKEPNDSIKTATPVQVPATIKGLIAAANKPLQGDNDLFRFEAKAGQKWIIEVNASRSKSPLDSYVQVLDANGKLIPRVLLRAVRDSYFTFRGKDSATSGDFRVHNWQEMELNEYLYANGEVVKLWHYPRGPDSGFLVYPGKGTRHTFFDTTATSHALQAPCYIVEPRPVGSTIIPNGLPVFTIYYENDDESKRRWGSDSKLTFTAPADGVYYVRLTDVRGFQGPEFKYTLAIRPPRPDFKVSLRAGGNPKINAGSGKEFMIEAERFDGFDGEIQVDVKNLPAGFTAASPLVIEAGQLRAFGVIRAAPDAKAPAKDVATASKLVAAATINGKKKAHDVGSLGEIKLAPKPKILVHLEPADGKPSDKPLELVIRPGQTITAKVRIERNGFKGRVPFGNEDSGRNLPHGVFVDNIGLNGLLIVEGKSERTFFITASKTAQPASRLFHVRTTAEGVQTSQPVLLHIRR